MRELLAPHGSIVVHVDPKTSHYVKVLCDEIFGEDAFASEIVWRYRRWPAKTPNFQRVHDVLLRYRKDPSAAPAGTSSTSRSRRRRSRPGEPRSSARSSPRRTEARRARSSSTTEPTAGAPMGDVWEIGVIAPVARERTGYPSQKPEALLERLVAALSDLATSCSTRTPAAGRRSPSPRGWDGASSGSTRATWRSRRSAGASCSEGARGVRWPARSHGAAIRAERSLRVAPRTPSPSRLVRRADSATHRASQK